MSFVTVAAGLSIGMGVNSLMGNPLGLGGGGAAGQQAQQMVDPFAPYRASYAQALNQFMGLGVGGPSGGAPASPLATAGGTGPLSGGHFEMRSVGGRPSHNVWVPGSPTATPMSPSPAASTPAAGGMSPLYGTNDPAYIAAMNIGLQGVQRANPGASGNALLALQDYGVNYQRTFSNDMFNRLATLSGAGVSPVAGGAAGIGAANLASANQSQAMGTMLSGLQTLSRSFGANPDRTAGTNFASFASGELAGMGGYDSNVSAANTGFTGL